MPCWLCPCELGAGRALGTALLQAQHEPGWGSLATGLHTSYRRHLGNGAELWVPDKLACGRNIV